MSILLPAAPSAWNVAQPEPITLDLQIACITPIFGGGAVARETGNTPVRAASVRGHLRFWWRATAGAVYKSSHVMYQEERDIWGDTNIPGNVGLKVVVTEHGKEYPVPANAPPKQGPREGYFLFPFAADRGRPAASGRVGVEFKLIVTMPAGFAKADEVERAVEAWITFGGIGARTRRGCGALALKENTETTLRIPRAALDVDYFRRLFSPLPENMQPEYSTLSGGWALIKRLNNAGHPDRASIDAWRELGNFWVEFRKGHFTDRVPELQMMLGCEWNDYDTLSEQQNQTIKLAKPYLGLPIIYGNIGKRFVGEVENEGKGRMASPIILKPVAFADGSYGAMVACLSAPKPTKLTISGQHYDLGTADVSDPVLKALDASSPLDAVRKAAVKRGFSEATA